jgi:hypothetical protein
MATEEWHPSCCLKNTTLPREFHYCILLGDLAGNNNISIQHNHQDRGTELVVSNKTPFDRSSNPHGKKE